MHVIIDTNILLNFFHFTKEDTETLRSVFASHKHGAVTVHLTEQVFDEFSRNRENKIKDSLKRFKELKFAAQLPAFMEQYGQYEQILQKSAELQELTKDISQKVDADVVENRLLPDFLIKDFFAKNETIPTTAELYGMAQMRVSLGNPPGKSGSMGDAVNWVALLNAVPNGENIHVISEDGDFYSTLDENRPHPFLKDEWRRKKQAEMFVYKNLSSFTKHHFDGVVFSYDYELTEREREILELLSRGESNRSIALSLNISHDTVKQYVHHILNKLNVSSRLNAVMLFIKEQEKHGDKS
ncbi:MAG: PIN domain-containing protein [Gallionellaceae bacterium]|nr:PIN domain-containing protein [Gallionellaceae bacterium]